MTPIQSRMARAALNWSVRKLAESAGVGSMTVNRFEGGIAEPKPATIARIRATFEAAGVEFRDDGSVAPPAAQSDTMATE
ncbi:MAG: XRE family transcriptional regulator [Alphaproteobacteria bacterium]|nr:MAG: XRE family transcriptional regulator [Alphaproteobacteria bacterium]